MDNSILQHIITDGLLDNFEITKVEEVSNKAGDGKDLLIYLQEYNKLPEGYEAKEYESKGFYPEKKIQDFAVRGKAGRARQGTLVASIKGTLTKDIVSVLEKIPIELRNNVKEVTLDMANNMESAASKSFPNARLVTDRFHVIRLAMKALQGVRIAFRWKELDKENRAIEKAKKSGKRYKAKRFSNGDTPKQLLARSRYILTKKPNEWTYSQEQRAKILFKHYPDIEKAYKHVLEFRSIYETQDKRKEYFPSWISNTCKSPKKGYP
jgi:transposase